MYGSKDYFVEPPRFLDRDNGIWISKQTLGSKVNIVKPHIHNAIEILYFINGNCVVIVDGIEYPVTAGDVVLFRSNSVHQIYSTTDGPTSHFVLQMTPSQIMELSGAEHVSTYLLRLSLSYKNEKSFWCKEECHKNGLTELFCELMKLEKSTELFDDVTVKILSARILLTILREICIDNHDHDEAIHGCIYNALIFINSNYTADITADICAKRVFMSYGHFSRSFKRATGANFKDYLNQIRVNHAQRALLSTNQSISEISRRCGFNTVSHFITMFRRLNGVTPAVYRDKFRNIKVDDDRGENLYSQEDSI